MASPLVSDEERLSHHLYQLVRIPRLSCRLLQCLDHSKPPCGLLMFRVNNPAHKRLSLCGFLPIRTILLFRAHPAVFSNSGLTAKVELSVFTLVSMLDNCSTPQFVKSPVYFN